MAILLCLRDKRHLNFKDFLLGVIETSFYNDPIYFNRFSNFSVSLRDSSVLNVLTLKIQTSVFVWKLKICFLQLFIEFTTRQ